MPPNYNLSGSFLPPPNCEWSRLVTGTADNIRIPWDIYSPTVDGTRADFLSKFTPTQLFSGDLVLAYRVYENFKQYELLLLFLDPKEGLVFLIDAVHAGGGWARHIGPVVKSLTRMTRAQRLKYLDIRIRDHAALTLDQKRYYRAALAQQILWAEEEDHDGKPDLLQQKLNELIRQFHAFVGGNCGYVGLDCNTAIAAIGRTIMLTLGEDQLTQVLPESLITGAAKALREAKLATEADNNVRSLLL